MRKQKIQMDENKEIVKISRWDQYFYNIAYEVSKNSRCLSRQIGAVIVREDKFIVSTGYNGPPMGFPNPNSTQWFNKVAEAIGDRADAAYAKFINKDGKSIMLTAAEMFNTCPRKLLGYESGESVHLCPCAHAERNAIDISGRLGHPTDGCVMYLTCSIPCRDCSLSIVNAGIKEVIVTELVDYESEGFKGADILKECGVEVRTYNSS